VEQEHKRDHVVVSLVMNVVQVALDRLLNHELVEHQSLTPDGQVSELGVHVQSDVEQELKRDHELVLLVIPVVQVALDHLPKHEVVEHQSLTRDGQVSVRGAHVPWHVELERKRDLVAVFLVIAVVMDVLEQLLKHELVQSVYV